MGKFRSVAIYFGLLIWVVVTSVILSAMSAKHTISFVPWSKSSLPNSNASWTMTHILGNGCECSSIVLDRLLERGRSEFVERVLLIDFETQSDVANKLTEKGFEIVSLKSTKLDDEEIKAVPSLVIQNENGDVLYSGGYSKHKVSKETKLVDLDVARSLQGRGGNAEEFPIFGCAVSHRYKNILNPWNLVKAGNK